jgi:hypothetical protein
VNILEGIEDPKVFGQHFRGETWAAWMVFLAALFALPMTPAQLELYRQCTGRSSPPATPFTEAWLCIGRRGGKSFILALIAVFLACFRDWRPYLGPGEIGTIMIIAGDRKQARVILRFCRGLLKSVPMLRRQIESETDESITLRNSIVIEVHTARIASPRGYTCVAVLLDELAYWPSDDAAANPDVEILAAVKPTMATIPNAMLLCASSPYSRKGALYDAYRKHWAQDDSEVLVWQASTRTMNSSVPQSYIDRHMAEDPARASAEYLAQFRSDLEQYVSREVVEECVIDAHERAPDPRETYVGFVDPASGSGSDSFVAAVGHVNRAKQTIIIDAMREYRPPFSPEAVTSEVSKFLRSYRISSVISDHWGGNYVIEQFAKFNIRCEQCANPKSLLYQDTLPLLNSRRLELINNERLINQLLALERRQARGGRPNIDHPPGAHDDLINAVAGVAVELDQHHTYDLEALAGERRDTSADAEAESFRKGRLARHILQNAGAPWDAVLLSPDPSPPQDSRNTRNLSSILEDPKRPSWLGGKP